MTFSEAKFTIRAVNKTQKAFTQINQGIGNMNKRFNKLGGRLSKVGALMATAFAGQKFVEVITKFESLEASLKTVTGSAEKASAAFGFVQEFASKTPFQLEEVTDAFIKLKALGLKPSKEALTSYGNTATAMGKSLNQMIEAVADATTGEFERLKEFGIKSKSQGDQVTFTFQGVSKTVKKNAAEIEKYLQSIGNVQFGGAMKEQAGTLKVALSNMEDAFAKLVKAIGDAGLTDLLILIADAIKWLADQATLGVKWMRSAFDQLIHSTQKFVNLMIGHFKGLGNYIRQFFIDIGNRFDAFGQDIANFMSNPLSGVSFENTKRAFEVGLVDSMNAAYDKALNVAREKNAVLDAEMQASADALIKAQQQKAEVLKSVLQGVNIPQAVNNVSNATQRFNKLQSEAQRIIEATRTPMELYNRELELLNKLLEKGYINQDTFNRGLGQAKERLENATKDSTAKAEEEFTSLGDVMQNSIGDALGNIGTEFDSFGDFFKGFMKDIGTSLSQTFIKDMTGKGEGGFFKDMLGGLFGSGGGASAGASGSGGFGEMLAGLGSSFGGFFAKGGTLKAGKFGIVGENGPELAFSGARPMQISPNTAMAPISINMNITTPDVGGFKHSQGQITAQMARAMQKARRNL